VTKQETFDTIVRALVVQGQPSMNAERTRCMYRGDGGTKCAAGHLIPDEDYDHTTEGGPITQEAIAIVLNRDGHDIDLVRELQRSHDGAACEYGACVGKFKQYARNVAVQFGLNAEAAA
jgi:hypothetical protein